MMRAIQGRTRRRVDRVPLLVLGLLLLLAVAPVIAHAQTDTLVIVWTAPGDDGAVGRAASYELRMSTDPINDANYASATVLGGLPAPTDAGTRQRTVVRGLTRGTTYYFALKSTDDVGNTSAISNVMRWDWVYDTAPPAAPVGLTASRAGDDANLQWSANAEPDLAGYTVYRASAAAGPWTVISPGLVPTNQFMDTAVPTDLSTVYYRVSASDGSGNESARSAVVSVSFGAAATIADWHMDPAYPNPSRANDAVRVPITIPVAGPGSAEAQIVDSGRRVVRRLNLGGLSGGSQELTWDGLNDSGRPVAPGVYTLWVTAGSTRASLRLVRVP